MKWKTRKGSSECVHVKGRKERRKHIIIEEFKEIK